MSGLLIWTAQFAVVYGVTAVACARGYGGVKVLGFGLIPFTIVAATLIALALTAGVLVYALVDRRRVAASDAPSVDRFLNYATVLISALSLAAIAWNGLPALIVPACL